MNAFTIEPYGRFWAVYDPARELVCVCVYQRGAREVVRRLGATEPEPDRLRETPPAFGSEAPEPF
jgi:hypothetical protein